MPLKDLLTGLFLLLASIIGLNQVSTMPTPSGHRMASGMGGGFFPGLLFYILLVAGSILIIKGSLGVRKEKKKALESLILCISSWGTYLPFLFILSLFLFLRVLPSLGFLLSSFLFLSLWVTWFYHLFKEERRILEPYLPVKVLLFSLGISILFFFFFRSVAGVYLPSGLMGGIW